MDQIKAILRNFHHSQSIKATARQLKVSKNTVRDYLRRALEHSNDVLKLLELEDSELENLFLKEPLDKQSVRLADFEKQTAEWIKELKKVGVTRYLLWETYRVSNPDGYGYSQFCEHLKSYVARKGLTLALEHLPGEVLMVDFAGKKLHWVDESTGELQDCEVLVAVFPCTQYCFCIALSSQSLPDFIEGINQAMLYFKGLPKVLLSDNLKAYVSKPERYEPTFTQLCEQLGVHYQIELQAARVRKPKDKASVENAVSQVYRSVYAPLRNEVFFSLQALNGAIIQQLEVFNEKSYQKKEGSRKSLFETYELPVMRPLPSDLFEIKKITRAKIQRNYHIFLPCVVFAKIIPIAALGVFTKRIRRSEWRFLALMCFCLAWCVTWCSPRSSQSRRVGGPSGTPDEAEGLVMAMRRITRRMPANSAEKILQCGD